MRRAYEIVCGLEVHAELATRSKIFCSCSTAFGAPPNSQTCPVCLGLPGALPVLNRRAVELAIRAGLALGCDIVPVSRFDRKSYFYPDLPKAYQITQFFSPICRGGGLMIPVAGGQKRVGIAEMHLEEDAGKLLHDAQSGCTLIDCNRAGVPLLEIVSAPDLRSAVEVVAFLESLREILLFLGVCDGKMQEGSLRADINLSVRPAGSDALGTRTEIKNMSSFRMIARAVKAEAARQIEQLEAGEVILQETRRWDEQIGASLPMREKESAGGYRYFPDPDLPPLCVDAGWIWRLAGTQPELPAAKRARYQSRYGLSAEAAVTLTASREVAALFEEAAALLDEQANGPKEAAHLIQTDVLRLMTDTATPPDRLSLSPQKLAVIAEMILTGRINRSAGKGLLESVFRDDVDPVHFVEEKGLAMLSDQTLIAEAAQKVLDENPQSVADLRAGKDKAFGFLVGQVMRALGGKADPGAVHRALRTLLG